MLKPAKRLVQALGHWFELATFRDHLIQTDLCGEVVKLHTDSLVSQTWYGRKHELAELAWVKAHLIRPGFVVADCGAHIGVTTCLFARWAGDTGQVFVRGLSEKPSMPPREHPDQSMQHRIVAENVALSEHQGLVRISTQTNARVVPGGWDRAGVLDVPATSLDSHFKGRQAPDFLKIDVEGHKEEDLRGARDILSQRPNVDLEIHSLLFAPETREATVARVLALVGARDAPSHIQLEVDGAIEPYQANVHTARLIASREVVHLFVRGRAGDDA